MERVRRARVGATRCNVEHVGLVIFGPATVAFDDGRVIESHVGDLFHAPRVPHYNWIIRDEPYVSPEFPRHRKVREENLIHPQITADCF